jgi:hypothetical protein
VSNHDVERAEQGEIVKIPAAYEAIGDGNRVEMNMSV